MSKCETSARGECQWKENKSMMSSRHLWLDRGCMRCYGNVIIKRNPDTHWWHCNNDITNPTWHRSAVIDNEMKLDRERATQCPALPVSSCMFSRVCGCKCDCCLLVVCVFLSGHGCLGNGVTIHLTPTHPVSRLHGFFISWRNTSRLADWPASRWQWWMEFHLGSHPNENGVGTQ